MNNTHDLTGSAGEPQQGRLESAPKRRRGRGRIPKACTQCHGRKQKCDGRHPCQNCILRGVSALCRPFSQAASFDGGSPRQRRPRASDSAPQLDASMSAAPEVFAPNDDAEGAKQSEAPQVGRLWKSRGAPSFFGSSYFGPQVAAALLDTPAPYVQPGANLSRRSTNARPFRDEVAPFSQLWELLGLLPRQRSTVDRLVNRFLNQVNSDIDAVHPRSFRREYERFYSRKAGLDDVTTVDIRWLALLFIILAIGVHLDCPRTASPEVQREYEESAMTFFWACRKAIVIAPSFYGESTDLVRAGILATRFCIFSQRITESWLTAGFAARLAMAQGLHIDGTHWKLARRETELRRRLWCQLYLLDRMISLALGRPYCIVDSLSLPREPENVFLDDVSDSEAETVQAQALANNPTQSVLGIFSYRLAKVIGSIHEQTCGLRATSYRRVMMLDAQLIAWKQSLPAYLAVGQPDMSQDQKYKFLQWHRLYLHTAFHFACITLHRPFVWRTSITDQHRYSREVCYAAACADLKTRLEHNDTCSSIDHSSWCLGVPQLFNSAIVLGMLAIQEHARGLRDFRPVINDLQSFCDKEHSEMWVNEFRLAEVKVIELCIERLKSGRKAKQAAEPDGTLSATVGHAHEQRVDRSALPASIAMASQPYRPDGECSAAVSAGGRSQHLPPATAHTEPLVPGSPEAGVFADSVLGYTMPMQPIQDFAEPFSFPGPNELDMWQEMIDSIGQQTGRDFL